MNTTRVGPVYKVTMRYPLTVKTLHMEPLEVWIDKYLTPESTTPISSVAIIHLHGWVSHRRGTLSGVMRFDYRGEVAVFLYHILQAFGAGEKAAKKAADKVRARLLMDKFDAVKVYLTDRGSWVEITVIPIEDGYEVYVIPHIKFP